MRVTIAAMAVFGVLLTVAAGPAGAQQQRWDAARPSGRWRQGLPFRLRNGEGAAIILQCLQQAVGAGFEFTEPIELTTTPNASRCAAFRASGGTSRSRRSSDRVFRVASGPGRRLPVAYARAAPRASWYARPGSGNGSRSSGARRIVSQCYLQQDNDLSVPSLGRGAGDRRRLRRSGAFRGRRTAPPVRYRGDLDHVLRSAVSSRGLVE